MIKRPAAILFYFIIDCFLLIVSLNHIPSLIDRSMFPFSVKEKGDLFVIEDIFNEAASTSLTIGDTIISVNDSTLTLSEQLEFISDNAVIGSNHKITTIKNGSTVSSIISTVPYYPNLLYIIVVFFIGLTFLSVGFFVAWSRPEDSIAHIFHWMMVFIGTVIMITWGSLESKEFSATIVRSLFFITYIFGIASFYLFTKLYCTALPRFIAIRVGVIYSISFIFSAILIYYHILAISKQSLTIYAQFQRYFDFFHIVLFIAFIAGIINIIRAYRRTDSSEERNRLEWIFWGFSISSTPFLLLYILPQILFSRYIIAEEYTTIFFIALPFSFGVSFIKHHLFDIRLLIKRTIVNFIFSVIIAVTYFIIVILAAAIIDSTILSAEHFIIVAVTLVIAMAFNPLRNRLKTFIDQLLFKAHSEYSNIQSKISQQLQRSVSREEIFTVVFETIQSSLPVEQCIIFGHENGNLIPNEQSNTGPNKAQPILVENIRSIIPRRVTAVQGIIRTENGEMVLIDNTLKSMIGCELFIPIKSVRIPILGAVGINRIKTHDRFDSEEISLLLMICEHAAEHLERLEMVETMFREKEERKKAEELNKLKSDFVSYVSHELQTPLTSIRMFSELLHEHISTTQGKEQLHIITGESDRLSRMVNNLLDVSRIEGGLKEYHFEPCSLNEIIGTVITKMTYMIKKHGFILRYSTPRSPLPILADSDAIEQAVMNLISNAIKYSRKRKYLRISVIKKNGYAVCSVQDKGDGISEKNIPFLFQRFYRLPEHHDAVKGVGLGLSLVKYIMDAHHGKIEVHSSPGKGSTFTLLIPLQQSSK
ncbi:MAG: GAF domain-containing sensor histidine kinase [Bacteroidota bacterium]